MRHFNFGDWVRHADDSACDGLVILSLPQGARVAWSDGNIDDHWSAELIIVKRSQIPGRTH